MSYGVGQQSPPTTSVLDTGGDDDDSLLTCTPMLSAPTSFASLAHSSSSTTATSTNSTNDNNVDSKADALRGAASSALPRSPQTFPRNSSVSSAEGSVSEVLSTAAHVLENDVGFVVGAKEDRNRHNRRTMETLQDLLRDRPDLSVPEALNDTFVAVDQQLKDKKIHSGCTAVVCFLQAQSDKRVLFTANAGDARAVLCRNGQAIRLSYDHKGSDNIEAERIMDLGGFVMNNRVNGVLAVTRALGDAAMKDLVIGNPFTTEIELIEDDDFIILACDGVWDVMTDQDAVTLILGIPDPAVAAERIVNKALENFSTDNISVIVVKLDHSSYYNLYPAARAHSERNRHRTVSHSASEDVVFDDADTPTQKSVAPSGSGQPADDEVSSGNAAGNLSAVYHRRLSRDDPSLADALKNMQVADQ
ncbi:mgpp2cl-1, protein phosphatase 2C-like protein 1 [Sorochytrium milnesiophthora]